MAADDKRASKSDFKIVSRWVFEALGKDIGARLCLQHSALLHKSNVVNVDNCQGSEDPATNFVISTGEQGR